MNKILKTAAAVFAVTFAGALANCAAGHVADCVFDKAGLPCARKWLAGN